MTHRTEELALDAPAPGTRQSLLLHRFGRPGARPKAYVQAAIHADEVPAMVAAHHLLQMLAAADRNGLVLGEVVLVPFANPVGLAQWVNQRHLGRHALAAGGNFNRDWPDLEEQVAERIEGRLGERAADNVACVRAALTAILEGPTAAATYGPHRLGLFRESVTADLVLDLHTDDEALLHLFLLPQHWPEAADLAAELGAAAVLLDEDTGGGAFDESNSKLWVGLQRRFPDRPLPAACLAATVELRGQGDASDALGRQDAGGLYRFLVHRGVVAGADTPAPPLGVEATPLAACQVVRSPAAGIVVYAVEVGERVTRGQTVAELIDPAAAPGSPRRLLLAETDGLVLSRRLHKLVRPQQTVAKIVGTTPLPPASAFVLEA